MAFIKYILLIGLIAAVQCDPYCYNEVYNQIGLTQIGSYQPTYEAAVAACNLSSKCYSITYMQTATQGYMYKLLSQTTQATLPSGARTWQKGGCSQTYANDGCTYVTQQSATFTECAQECKKFKNLEDALAACKLDVFCSGVTYTNLEYSIFLFLFFQGEYSYQLRSGQLISSSKDPKAVSYEKTGCIQYDRCSYSSLVIGESKGCVQGCQDFATFQQAKAACDLDDSCNAVTFTSATNGGLQSSGASGNGYGYQLRGNTTVINDGTDSISFLKSCIEQCLPSDERDIVVANPLQLIPSPGPALSLNNCKPDSYEGNYLGGCVNNCQDYSTLDEALINCGNYQGCNGITLSSIALGGSNSKGPLNGFGYQLRQGPSLSLSYHGESSWLKCSQSSQYLKSLCVYQQVKNRYLQSSNLIPNQVFNNYADACTYCDSQSTCQGIQYDQANNYYLPASSVDNYSSNTYGHVYLKNSCNNQNYINYSAINNNNYVDNQPVGQQYNNNNINGVNNILINLYPECNYQGQSYIANPTESSIDFSQYKSMRVPSGFYAQVYPNPNYGGTYQQVNQSIQCQQNTLANYFSLQNHGSLRLSKVN